MLIRRDRRKVPDINSSSTADIAFLLLIFFLLTTSMNTDFSLARRLPPAPASEEQVPPVKVKERNIFRLHLTANDRWVYDGREQTPDHLKRMLKLFITNPQNRNELPEKEEKEVDFMGIYPVSSKHVISLEVDKEASYDSYIRLQNTINQAYKEARSELARSKWNCSYEELSMAQQRALRTVYPVRIFEVDSDD